MLVFHAFLFSFNFVFEQLFYFWSLLKCCKSYWCHWHRLWFNLPARTQCTRCVADNP